MKCSGLTADLLQLASLYGIQVAYYDNWHRRRVASSESLLAALKCLGCPITRCEDAQNALRDRGQAVWKTPVEPVTVAWDGLMPKVEMRLPEDLRRPSIAASLALETGETRELVWRWADLTTLRQETVEGVRYAAKQATLPDALPFGYHGIRIEIQGEQVNSLIISAPLKSWKPAPTSRKWGLFVPTYALRSQGGLGAGDLSDLRTLMDWATGMGCSVVGTLPLLASFLDEPFEPSPYAPVSRLFWNEFYADVRNAPELERCPDAQSLLESELFRRETEALRSLSMVDYRRCMALKRQVLERLAACCFGHSPQGTAELQAFIDARPETVGYARFRATTEKRREPWPAWPSRIREGHIQAADYDQDAMRYHIYVQWLAHRQMESLARNARSNEVGLYLDLPLGSHPEGYDTYRWRELFALDASTGAPPDPLAEQGQDWGFPPMHPEKLREQGYEYYVNCVRHHLRVASALRIDHVMGFHRLYWIPDGIPASQGVYVRYPADEFYAILSLESHRYKATIVGEDLGTVPPYVRRAMSRHGLHRMYVLPFQVRVKDHAVSRPRSDSVAALNTHDMPPFTSYWQGLDIQKRREMGFLTARAERQERARRRLAKSILSRFLRNQQPSDAPDDAQATLKACLAWLSNSAAPLVLVNMEDLWQETEYQNMPGTADEHPNWRRKCRHSIEELDNMPEVVETLQLVDSLRRGGKDIDPA